MSRDLIKYHQELQYEQINPKRPEPEPEPEKEAPTCVKCGKELIYIGTLGTAGCPIHSTAGVPR